jgi:nucleolin
MAKREQEEEEEEEQELGEGEGEGEGGELPARRKRKRKRKGRAQGDLDPDAGGVADAEVKAAAGRAKSGATDHQEVQGADACTVYVEGIPWGASDSDVLTFFEGCGSILDLRMPRWNDTGRARGYAHVEFDDSEGSAAAAVESALQLSGQDMGGRYLTVVRANARGQKHQVINWMHSSLVRGACVSVF